MTGEERSPSGGHPVRVEAHAKVNLTLEILGKRTDGFHNLVSIMQTIELHDVLELSLARDVSVECDDPRLGGEDNLVSKAAFAMREAAFGQAAPDDAARGVHIRLAKSIPIAAGLGGGSSDAAATLAALNRLWRMNWPAEKLLGIAAGLGSDVPFFIRGGTALVQGRGEDVVSLPPADLGWLVVLAPEIDLQGKTGKMFGLVTPADYTRGVLSHKLAGRIRGGGDAPAQFFFNAFDRLAPKAFPELEGYRAAFSAVGAREVILCGAGPSMFAVAPTREVGLAWQLLLKGRGMRAYLTRRWTPPLGAR